MIGGSCAVSRYQVLSPPYIYKVRGYEARTVSESCQQKVLREANNAISLEQNVVAKSMKQALKVMQNPIVPYLSKC